MGWHLFDPLEYTIENKKERQRSARPKKTNSIETAIQQKRPSSAQRPV